jgi:hypothetical protein
MFKPPDYDAIEIEMWRENAENVLISLNKQDRYLLKKIRTYSWRFGYTEDEIRRKIENDNMFKAWFAKEPRRQGFYEIVAGEYLKQFDLMRNFQILNKGGESAEYITSDGHFLNGKELQDSAIAKSMDFKWKTGKFHCYASHKYPKESGENQDSQYKEQKSLLRSFLNKTKGDVVFFAICDGMYYNEKRMQTFYSLTR